MKESVLSEKTRKMRKNNTTLVFLLSNLPANTGTKIFYD